MIDHVYIFSCHRLNNDATEKNSPIQNLPLLATTGLDVQENWLCSMSFP